ncbi:MAG: ABC transporter substrate-binding protein [Verrucomicrobia bacterium]|nr:ABC transporter substrate-binding protein [Verrucomicrobiota bacterium]MDE3099870.1 ABC transporter substrate-binding protein [Verrucomicrobiota bacterium]
MNSKSKSSSTFSTRRQFLKSAVKGAVATAALGALHPFTARAAGGVEKPALKFGFIKLTDCAPLVIALENGYFEDEGLFVSLEAQANWKILLDRVISGELDGAHMLAGQPIAATIGIGTKANVITPFSMDLNGNGITVSNDLWKQMQQADPKLNGPNPPHPISAESLVPIVKRYKDAGSPLKFGMVFPVSTHNYYLRYWLAAAGISPGYYINGDTTGTTNADVLLSVTPPPQMPATLAQGTIQGYCVGEPWNEQAVFKGIGVAVITDYEIWKNNPEKVFGITENWSNQNPQTLIAVVKALIRAGQWLDASHENRVKACKILSQPQYVGADEQIIAHSMTGSFAYQKTDIRSLPDFNVFFRYFATYPFYSDCIWFLTQMRRWGQIAANKPDNWYADTAKQVYRPDIYVKAANTLVAEGKIKPGDIPQTDGFKAPDGNFIDAITFDARKPNDYLKQFKAGLKS